MIDGATEIISGIQGKYLDPLLLAQSQTTSALSLIVVAYNTIPRDGSTASSKFYDLFFLRGSAIVDCARLSQDLRFHQQLDQALATFKSSGARDTSRVYLFQPSQEAIERFRSTFYYEPSLKVQLESLSKKQMTKLLSTTRCSRGIIECDNFAQPVPDIRLLEIHSSEELLLYEPSSKRGQLIVYDIENNRQFVRDQYSTISLGQGFAPSSLAADHPNSPPVLILRRHPSAPERGKVDRGTDDANPAQEFSLLVADILKSSHAKQTPNTESPTPLADETDAGSTGSQGPTQIARSKDVETNQQAKTLRRTHRKPDPKNPPLRAMRGRANTQGDPAPQTQSETRTKTSAASNDKPEFVRLFERIFRSFRQVGYQCLGDRWDSILSHAETQARLLVPELDVASLNEDTAPSVLNVIEYIATEAPLLKRARLRNAATTLIADIYNKQYELLEQQNRIDLVEQIYFRLKK